MLAAASPRQLLPSNNTKHLLRLYDCQCNRWERLCNFTYLLLQREASAGGSCFSLVADIGNYVLLWKMHPPAAVPTSKNLTSGILNTILRWQWRQIAMALSARTADTPGAWYSVEHSEQVGRKLLLRVRKICSQRQSINFRQDKNIPGQKIHDCAAFEI